MTVPDATARPVATKLLDRPDIVDALRSSFDGRPAFIEPWNVTECEVEVARRLGTPMNGTVPELWPLGYKSAGRKLFAETGTPTPFGVEDVRTVDGAMAAIAAIRAARPGAPGVVIKHDNSGAGDGNVVIRLPEHDDAWSDDSLRRRLEGLPPWYLGDLRDGGGVVEELIVGEQFTSPSVQVDIRPSGAVSVLATHDQVLGAPTLRCTSAADSPPTRTMPPRSPAMAVWLASVSQSSARWAERASTSPPPVTPTGGTWPHWRSTSAKAAPRTPMRRCATSSRPLRAEPGSVVGTRRHHAGLPSD